MKKLMISLCASLMLFGMVGCANQADKDIELSIDNTTEEESEPYWCKMEEGSYYFANIDHITEFSSCNEGYVHYDRVNNEIQIGVTRRVEQPPDIISGTLEGPKLRATMDMSEKTVLERIHIPQSDSDLFVQSQLDNGEMEEMSDERLIEISQILLSNILEYEKELGTD